MFNGSKDYLRIWSAAVEPVVEEYINFASKMLQTPIKIIKTQYVIHNMQDAYLQMIAKRDLSLKDAHIMSGDCVVLTSSGTVKLTFFNIIDIDTSTVYFYDIAIDSPFGYDRVFEGVPSHWASGERPTLDMIKKHLKTMLRTCGRL